MLRLGGPFHGDRYLWLVVLAWWLRLSGWSPRPVTCLTLTPVPGYRELP